MTHIETDRLIIRPLRMEDAESMFEYASETEITQHTSWEPHKSIEDTKAFIREAIKNAKHTPLDPLAITFKDQPDVVIGTLGVSTKSNPYECELAYGLSRKYWQQGVMFEASSALIEKVFKEGDYIRIFATCAKENIASKSLMKKLGMQFEGCLRSKAYVKGQIWDVEYYSILKKEWESKITFLHDQEQTEYPFIYEAGPVFKDLHVLENGLDAYGRLKKGMDPMEPFGFFVRNVEGETLAGCKGVFFYGCLYTELLWVSEKLRGKGIGTKLIKAAEELGRAKGCSMATINTMDWEALDLYKNLGYKVDLAREGYKNDSTFYFLKKELV